MSNFSTEHDSVQSETQFCVRSFPCEYKLKIYLSEFIEFTEALFVSFFNGLSADF